jgi:immunity protein 26 of polymorphic toxin system
MSEFKKTRWKPGMVFAIPVDVGKFGIAQAIDSMMENVIYIAVFSDLYDEIPEEIEFLDKENVISLHATWKQDLNNGTWAKVGILPSVASKSDFPNEEFASSGYVGAKHSSAGIFNDFLAAYHGVAPWNVMTDENYWDSYLNAGKSRPDKVILLTEDQRKEYRNSRKGISDA